MRSDWQFDAQFHACSSGSYFEGKKLLTENFAELHCGIDIVRVCLDDTEVTKPRAK